MNTGTHVAESPPEPCYDILPGIGMTIKVAREPMFCYWHAYCREKQQCFWRVWHQCDQRGRPETKTAQGDLKL